MTTPAPGARPPNPCLALGDEFTSGIGITAAERWPVQLATKLREYNVGLADPEFIAGHGWTTADLQQALTKSGNHRTDYEFVSLLIGLNNQYQHNSLAFYDLEFRQLLAAAQHYAGDRAYRVLVLSIPDWGFTPFAAGEDRAHIGHAIDEFNYVARRACEQAAIAFINITPLTRAIGPDPTQLVANGPYYSGEQLRRWVAAAFPTAFSLLRNDGRYTGATH
ncbi:MAG: SGNH/GDSL hydrolase family protein [Janthinobacterium lividum]